MPAMPTPSELDELIQHLSRTGPLTARQAAHLLDTVFAWLDETPDAFVRRRHQALQREGLGNDAIFRQLEAELRGRRFAAPAFSPRQLRRLVYG